MSVVVYGVYAYLICMCTIVEWYLVDCGDCSGGKCVCIVNGVGSVVGECCWCVLCVRCCMCCIYVVECELVR